MSEGVEKNPLVTVQSVRKKVCRSFRSSVQIFQDIPKYYGFYGGQTSYTVTGLFSILK